MTLTHVVLFFSHLLFFAGGYYAHYRWGAKLAALEAKAKSAV